MTIKIDWVQNDLDILIGRMLSLKPFTKMKMYQSGQIDTIENSIFPETFSGYDDKDEMIDFSMENALFADAFSLVIVGRLWKANVKNAWRTLVFPMVMFV